jgi:hypothetical protein
LSLDVEEAFHLRMTFIMAPGNKEIMDAGHGM